MKEIVLLDPIYGPSQSTLVERFKVHDAPAQGPDRTDFLRQFAGRTECVVSHSRFGMSSAEMDALPSLRLIANFGVGLDRLDVDEAARRGITVTHTPDELTECVADMAWALMLGVTRRILPNDQFVRAGQWLSGSAPLSQKLWGENLGIVGAGRIGQAIARRATGFNMEIGYVDPFSRITGATPFEHVKDLAAWAKVLIVACPGTRATRHIIDADVLMALGVEGYLVNISRGSNVDEKALVDAIAAGRIAGAGLDVFESEPEVPPTFAAATNVLLQPHVSSGTRQTYAAMGRTVVENLEAFYAGNPLRNVAPPSRAV